MTIKYRNLCEEGNYHHLVFHLEQIITREIVIYKFQATHLLPGSSQGDHDEDDGLHKEDDIDALAASRPHRLT